MVSTIYSIRIDVAVNMYQDLRRLMWFGVRNCYILCEIPRVWWNCRIFAEWLTVRAYNSEKFVALAVNYGCPNAISFMLKLKANWNEIWLRPLALLHTQNLGLCVVWCLKWCFLLLFLNYPAHCSCYLHVAWVSVIIRLSETRSIRIYLPWFAFESPRWTATCWLALPMQLGSKDSLRRTLPPHKPLTPCCGYRQGCSGLR